VRGNQGGPRRVLPCRGQGPGSGADLRQAVPSPVRRSRSPANHGNVGRMTSDDVRQVIAHAHRREWAFVLAATAPGARALDLAEECVQDAYVAALDAWVRQGVPDNPGAWLTTAARNRALDAHRRDKTLRGKLPLLIEAPPPEPNEYDPPEIPDDRLRLMFTC